MRYLFTRKFIYNKINLPIFLLLIKPTERSLESIRTAAACSRYIGCYTARRALGLCFFALDPVRCLLVLELQQLRVDHVLLLAAELGRYFVLSTLAVLILLYNIYFND